MFFPSEITRKRFYDLILELTANEDCITDLDSIMETGPIEVIDYFYQLFLVITFIFFSLNMNWMNKVEGLNLEKELMEWCLLLEIYELKSQ